MAGIATNRDDGIRAPTLIVGPRHPVAAIVAASVTTHARIRPSEAVRDDGVNPNAGAAL
jgi:hypothetical protein